MIKQIILTVLGWTLLSSWGFGATISRDNSSITRGMESSDNMNYVEESNIPPIVVGETGSQKNVNRVDEPPTVIYYVEGEEKWYNKQSAGFYVQTGGSMDYYEESGVAAAIVYGDNNEVYFRCILTKLNINSYVKGKLEDDKIIVELPQTVYYYTNYGYGLELNVLKHVEYPNAQDGKLEDYVINEDYSSVIFNIAEDGTISLEDLGEDGLLGLTKSTDDDWQVWGDFYQIYTPADEMFVTLPEDLPLTDFILNANGIGHEIKVGIDGNDIYFVNFFDYWEDCVIKGKLDGDKVYLYQEEYEGIYNGRFIQTRCMTEPSPGIWHWADPDVVYEFDYDAETQTFTCVDPDLYYVLSIWPENPYSLLSIAKNIKISLPAPKEGIPSNPFNLSWSDMFLDYYNFYSFIFSLRPESVDGNVLDPDCLYYRIFLDDELLEFIYDPDEGDFGAYRGLYELTTEIPYNFSNGIDIYCMYAASVEREVGIYTEGVSTMGVQAVYIYNDVTTESAIVTLDVETGEVTIGEETTNVTIISSDDIVNVEYYSIDGKTMQNPGKGIFIKKVTLKNGDILTQKIIR